MNRRNRAGSFVLVFGAVCTHVLDTTGHGLQPAWACAWAALHFLVYPQVAFALARRAADPLRAEIHNLMLDSFLFGIWVAALAFPLWISFSMVACTLMNLSAFRGVRGLLQAVAAVMAGTTLGVVGWGLRFAPETAWPSTAFSMFGLLAFMLLFARDVYLRTLKLREASAQLSASESSLQQTNAALQQKLDEIHRLQHRLNEQATHDALTGLHNRHFLGNAFDKALARCRQDNLPLAVVLIDVDHFKQVNDVYGHLAGDEVLRQLARRLDSSARASDVVCRYGGEEFLLLLVGMDLQGALSRADALRQQVEHKGIDWESTVLHVTVSAGVALFPTHGTHPDALIQAADLALYRAKSLGRNRVMAAS